MQTLEQLRGKIDSAESLHSVVKTMKAIAAVNIRQFEESVESLDLYFATVERAWQVTLRQATFDEDLRLRGAFEERTSTDPTGPRLAIALGSDQGMCGQFDRLMAEFVLDEVDDGSETGFLIAGSRLRGHLDTAPHPHWGRLPLPRSAAGITDVVEDVLEAIDASTREHGVRSIVLFHHEPSDGTSYRPRRVSLLPLDLDWLEQLRTREWPSNHLPFTASATPAMVRVLTRETLFVELYRAFAASLAAENASRLAAMQAAENSIEDRLDDLQQQYYRQRQGSITQELLEVVSGFTQAAQDD